MTALAIGGARTRLVLSQTCARGGTAPGFAITSIKQGG
jgi:hypothetical protein